MTTDRRGIALLACIGLASYALIVALQPYSVRSPWRRWDEPGRRYFEAAARLDTAALQRLSGSPSAVDWALRAGRTGGPALAPWGTLAHASMGFHRSDTVDVWYGTLTDPCSYRLSFVGEPRPRVVGADASCNYSAGWPIDPNVIKISR
jgi:hypothetical protein